MLLQTVRPNIVQAIRAYRVEDLMQAAQEAGQHFLYANLSEAQSKQDVLDGIAQAFLPLAAGTVGERGGSPTRGGRGERISGLARCCRVRRCGRDR